MKTYDYVKEFNTKIIGIKEPNGKIKKLEDKKFIWLVGRLIEETNEMIISNLENDVNGVLDGLNDLIYYAIGAQIKMGVNKEQFEKLWDEIQKSNMSKIKGNKGRGTNDDAIKPKNWKGPKGII